MAMDIYNGKSMVQVLLPWGKVWIWSPGLGLDMPSRFSGGRASSNRFVLTMEFNNERVDNTRMNIQI